MGANMTSCCKEDNRWRSYENNALIWHETDLRIQGESSKRIDYYQEKSSQSYSFDGTECANTISTSDDDDDDVLSSNLKKVGNGKFVQKRKCRAEDAHVTFAENVDDDDDKLYYADNRNRPLHESVGIYWSGMIASVRAKFNAFQQHQLALKMYRNGVEQQNKFGNYEQAIVCYHQALICYYSRELDDDKHFSKPIRRSSGNNEWIKNLKVNLQRCKLNQECIQKALKVESEGNECEMNGNYKEAKNHYENALQIVQNQLKTDLSRETDSENRDHCERQHSIFYFLSTKLGIVTWKLGQYDSALNLLLYSINGYEMLESQQRPRAGLSFSSVSLPSNDHMEALYAIGMVFIAKGMYDDAILRLKKVLEAQKSTYGPYHSSVANTLSELATAYNKKGQHKKAMKIYKVALNVQVSCCGEGNVHVAAILNRMGVLYDSSGFYEKAMIFHEDALDIYLSLLGRNHVDTATTLNNMGEVYRHIGDLDKALEHYEDALDIMQTLMPDRNHRNIAALLHNIGAVLIQQGHTTKAMNRFSKALSIQKALLGEINLDVALTLQSMASLFSVKKKFKRAHTFYNEVLKIRRKVLRRTHLAVAATLVEIGNFFYLNNLADVDANYLEQALRVFDEAKAIYKINGIRGENEPRMQDIEEKVYNLEHGISYIP